MNSSDLKGIETKAQRLKAILRSFTGVPLTDSTLHRGWIHEASDLACHLEATIRQLREEIEGWKAQEYATSELCRERGERIEILEGGLRDILERAQIAHEYAYDVDDIQCYDCPGDECEYCYGIMGVARRTLTPTEATEATEPERDGSYVDIEAALESWEDDKAERERQRQEATDDERIKPDEWYLETREDAPHD